MDFDGVRRAVETLRARSTRYDEALVLQQRKIDQLRAEMFRMVEEQRQMRAAQRDGGCSPDAPPPEDERV
jgi:hypothetical protein